MPPEDELNDPEGRAALHPEAAASPESVLPATESLKETILARVEAEAKAGERSSDGAWHASKVSADGLTRIRVHFYPTPDEDGHVGGVIATTDYNEREGTGIDTGYRILRIPDGLHIERHVRDHIDVREKRPGVRKTHEETIASAEETIAMVERSKEARNIEKELDLRFFSLKDAKDLLALLENSKVQP